jgi:hypothetical protein
MINLTEALNERSKTEVFKEHLQKVIYQTLGIKVSKSKAWDLFKATTHGTVEFVLNLPTTTNEEGEESAKKLPLAGVGTFEILETKPRGSKAGLDKDGNPMDGVTPWPCVPRFRFYPSSTIDNLCEYKYGLGNHEITEKHYGLFVEDEAVEAVAETDTAVEEAVAVEEVAEVTAPADLFDDEI